MVELMHTLRTETFKISLIPDKIGDFFVVINTLLHTRLKYAKTLNTV